jgi:hypothetical protein
VKNSSLNEILMVVLAQLEGGLRGYMGVWIWRTESRGSRHLEIHYSLRPHGSEHLL